MKIQNLNLLSFGPFTDRKLDFSKSNLNLVYGPNEAGKSSSLRAIIALLYGIPVRTEDDFVHRKADLRIGATLVNHAGRQLSFVRRKKNKGSLVSLDSPEKTLPENVLDDFLRGTEKQRFCDIHCIDHEQFRAGGKLMLELQGLADDSLLAASNSANFPSLQSSLRDQITEIYAPRKSTSRLLQAKKAFDEAKKIRKDREVLVKQWQTLQEQRAELERRKEELDAQRRDIRIQQKKLAQLRTALPKIAEWKRRCFDLEGQSLTVLPAHYDVEARRDCEKQLDVVLSKLTLFDNELTELTNELHKVQEEPKRLAHATRIEHLQQRIGQQLSERDLAETRRLELEHATLDVQKMLQDLGVTVDESPSDLGHAEISQAEEWRLPREQRSTIQQLATEEKELRQRSRSLQSQISEHQLTIQQLQSTVEAAPEAIDFRPLEDELKATKNCLSLEDDIELLTSRARTLQEQLDRTFNTLPLWKGSLQELISTPVPLPETISRFAHDSIRLAEKLSRAQVALADTRAEKKQLQDRIDAANRATQVVTEENLYQARETRDRSWEAIKKIWIDGSDCQTVLQQLKQSMPTVSEGSPPDVTPETPIQDLYETQVADADLVSDRLRREADAVAELAHLQTLLASLTEKVATLEEDEAQIHSETADWNHRWKLLWDASLFQPIQSPREMAEWIELRNELVAKAVSIAELEDERTQKQARHDRAYDKLHRAFVKCADEQTRANLSLQLSDEEAGFRSLNGLVDRAESIVEQIASQRNQHQKLAEQLEELKKEVSKLELQAKSASAELNDWQQGWSRAMLWIRCEPDTTAPQALARIEQIEMLTERNEHRLRLQRESKAAKSSSAQFHQEVTTLCQELNLPNQDKSEIELAEKLKAALDEARQQQRAATRLREAIDKQDLKISEQLLLKKGLEKTLAEFLTAAKVDSPDQLAAVESFSTLVRQRDALEDEIRQIAGSTDWDDFLAAAEGKDEAELEAQIEDLETADRELEQKRDLVTGDLNQAELEMTRIDGNDGYARADQQAMNELAKIHQLVGQYVRLKIADSILRQQIERYREENKDPLLAKASEYFAEMTNHEFLGLQIDYDDKSGKPIIVGTRSHNRKPVDVSAMSDGTRDPMFLALRFAYLQRRLEAYEPMPFIVDDILIHLDDQRALATLRVLAELSKDMQILFFTHHERLRDLAEQNLPTDVLTVHELDKTVPV